MELKVKRITFRKEWGGKSNPITAKQKQRRAHLERARARNQATRNVYNRNGCVRCGSHDRLQNHHVFEVEGEKNNKLGRMWGSADKTFKLELAKTIPVCPDCHDGIHEGEWDITEEEYARRVLWYTKLRRSV